MKIRFDDGPPLPHTPCVTTGASHRWGLRRICSEPSEPDAGHAAEGSSLGGPSQFRPQAALHAENSSPLALRSPLLL